MRMRGGFACSGFNSECRRLRTESPGSPFKQAFWWQAEKHLVRRRTSRPRKTATIRFWATTSPQSLVWDLPPLRVPSGHVKRT